MTQPIPPVDPGNRYLGPVLCDLSMSRAKGADPATGLTEEQAVLTIRAGNATLTVMLTKAELGAWIESMAGTWEQMTGLTLAGPGQMPPGNGGPRR